MRGGESMAVSKTFRKVTRTQAKASILIEGLAGTGKSGLALAFAKALATAWDKIYAIDTENQSLDLFDGTKLHTGEKIEEFNKVDLTEADGFAPSNYQTLRDIAIKAGAEVVIFDSYSHMWTRQGGVLDKVSNIEGLGNRNIRAWNDPEVRREKDLIFELVRSPYAHIVSTVRTKEKFSIEKDEATNKTAVVSLGEQQVQQDGLKYEPDLVLRMEQAGSSKGAVPVATVLKSRYEVFEKHKTYEFDAKLLKQFTDYIQKGVDPEVILEQQRQDYIEGIKEYCKGNKTRMSVWKSLKESAGFVEDKIEDIPLETIRELYIRLTQD